MSIGEYKWTAGRAMEDYFNSIGSGLNDYLGIDEHNKAVCEQREKISSAISSTTVGKVISKTGEVLHIVDKIIDSEVKAGVGYGGEVSVANSKVTLMVRSAFVITDSAEFKKETGFEIGIVLPLKSIGTTLKIEYIDGEWQAIPDLLALNMTFEEFKQRNVYIELYGIEAYKFVGGGVHVYLNINNLLEFLNDKSKVFCAP